MDIEIAVALLASTASLVLALVAVAGYVDARKKLRDDRKKLDLLSDGVKALTAISADLRRQFETQAAYQKTNLDLQKQAMNLRILEGVFKGFGWAWEQGWFE